MLSPWRAIDRWLFAPGSARCVAIVRTGLAALIGLRIAVGPYRQLAGQPASLFEPPPFLSWLPSMPSVGVIAALQIVGVVAAVFAVAQRRPAAAFAIAWASLLVLAGLKDSLGKILHNDVLLLLAAVPLLAAPGDARIESERRSARDGWSVRAAMIVVAGAYFTAGVEKLVHSGLDWVAGDNMRWILYQAASGGRAHTRTVALFIADRPWLAHVTAAAILGTELVAPLVLVWRRVRPWFVTLAVVLHVGTWLTLGLDYWGWAVTVAVVLFEWDRVGRGSQEARASRQDLPASTSTSWGSPSTRSAMMLRWTSPVPPPTVSAAE